MEYLINLLKKSLKSLVVTTILIFVLWGMLYSLTDWATVGKYVGIGVVVCIFNTFLANLKKRKVEKIFQVQGMWVIMAGVVLLLFHAGFDAAAVLVAAAIFVSPFFWATVYEGIVGLSLLITIAWQVI